MAVPRPYGWSDAGLLVVPWVAALASAAAPWILLLIPIPGVRRDADFLFLVAPVTGVVALVLAAVGLAVIRRTGAPAGLFAVALGLLAVNVGLLGLASLAWWTIPTCGGGLSGPCYTPLFFCGFGLVFTIAAAIVAGVGVIRLRRYPTRPGMAYR